MKRIWSLILCVTLLSLLLGCTETPAEKETKGPTEQKGARFAVSAVASEDPMRVEYAVAGTERTVRVQYLDEVTVAVDGKTVSLETAVTQGLLTPEQIVADVRLDAADGYCTSRYESNNGLSTFYYVYETYAVAVTHDVLETPDGKQHLIDTVDLYRPGTMANAQRIYLNEQGEPLDREDWGLTFTVTESNRDGLALVCKQAGGQHFGTLTLDGISVLDSNTDEFVSVQNQEAMNELHSAVCETVLSNGGTTELVFAWTDAFGGLPAGNYSLWLTVRDVYEKEAVHPLVRNYHDSQTYKIEFTVP